MRKIVEFNKSKRWGFGAVDVDALNKQLEEIEKQGWRLVSINTNAFFTGFVVSYTLLIES